MHSYIIMSSLSSDLNSGMHQCSLISPVGPAPSVILGADWTTHHKQFIRSAEGIFFRRVQWLRSWTAISKSGPGIYESNSGPHDSVFISICITFINRTCTFTPSCSSLHGHAWVQRWFLFICLFFITYWQSMPLIPIKLERVLWTVCVWYAFEESHFQHLCLIT